MHTLTLTPPAKTMRPTKILVGDGLLDRISTVMSLGAFDRIAILYDESIEPLALRVGNGLPLPLRIAVASGDASKSLLEADRIIQKMLEGGCTKKTLLLCVGGGMLTDLGGFVASVFMRGITCVLVPTTLLGMADAAIGGKTAVNTGNRKNMIGTITHPLSVVIDTQLLQSLPAPQLKEGLVEIIKIAAITDVSFFEWLEGTLEKLLKRDPNALLQCVTKAVEAKIRIVEADDRDTDIRLLLNFGHTVGHAVEALSEYQLPHGQAVAIGMGFEMDCADTKEKKRVTALLSMLGISLEIPKAMRAEDLWNAMLVDKKNDQGNVRIAVPTKIGAGELRVLSRDQFFAHVHA